MPSRVSARERGRTRDGSFINVFLEYTKDELDEPPVNGTSTVFMLNSGRSYPYTFATLYLESNPALKLAMDKASMAAQQAKDALGPSNLALLLMPLALNLVPLALFAAVSTRVMVACTVMSGTLTVIPLAIKGIKLIVIGGQKRIAINTRYTTRRKGTLSIEAAAEVWGSEWQANSSVQPIGIVFVILAMVFMIGGIFGELWPWRYIERRNKRCREQVEEDARGALIGAAEEDDDKSYVLSTNSASTQIRKVHTP